MRTWLKVLGGIAVIVVSFLATNLALDWWSSGPCIGADRVELRKPFTKSGGFAFSALAPGFSSVANMPGQADRSPLKLCEDGKLLGPPHQALADISANGKGRFTHWGDNVYFSASDNSDPNGNGRRYSLGP